MIRKSVALVFGGCLVATAAALSPSINVIVELSATTPPFVTCTGVADGRDGRAINTGINTVAASGGGILNVQAGTCMIDAVQFPVVMKSNVRLQLDPAAVLQTIPNSAGNTSWTHFYTVLAKNISNAGIYGGQIIGDRVGHSGSTGEWGFGIGLLGVDTFTISGTKISDCWGDGILVSGGGPYQRNPPSKNVTIDSVVSDNSRRQGLSGIHWAGGTITNSTFSNTNGAAPQCGIDLEPSLASQKITNISITNSTFSNNSNCGIVLNAQSGDVNHITISNNTITSNGGSGIALAYSSNNTISNNSISLSGVEGLALVDGLGGIPSWGASTNNTVTGNTIASSSQQIGYGMNIFVSGSSSNNTFTDNILTSSASKPVACGVWIDASTNISNTFTNKTNTGPWTWCVGGTHSAPVGFRDRGTGTIIF